MALFNRATWAQRFLSFINRTPPFDGDPLIQKADHQIIVGQDLPDSVIFRDPQVFAINNPALPTIDVNFNLGDRCDIDVTGSVDTDFILNVSNLQGQDTGIINITKKVGDSISFSNVNSGVFNSFFVESSASVIFRVKLIAGVVVSEQLFPSIHKGVSQDTSGLFLSDFEKNNFLTTTDQFVSVGIFGNLFTFSGAIFGATGNVLDELFLTANSPNPLFDVIENARFFTLITVDMLSIGNSGKIYTSFSGEIVEVSGNRGFLITAIEQGEDQGYLDITNVSFSNAVVRFSGSGSF